MAPLETVTLEGQVTPYDPNVDEVLDALDRHPRCVDHDGKPFTRETAAELIREVGKRLGSESDRSTHWIIQTIEVVSEIGNPPTLSASNVSAVYSLAGALHPAGSSHNGDTPSTGRENEPEDFINV